MRDPSALTRLSVLFLTIVATLYLAALLGLALNPSVALCVALTVGGATASLCGTLRETKLDPPDLFGPLVGLILVAWVRPRIVDSLNWDVVSYGLLKYPEMREWIVGPYFNYGNVYEFLVSYVDQLLPPVGGISLLHTLSLFFLAVFACNYARATRSQPGLAACLLLLFYDPTKTVTPELSYIAAGKNDVLVAALVLQVWAVFLDRRNSRGKPIGAFEFAVTNAVAACAVGSKMSAIFAIALPLAVYWGEFLDQSARKMSRLRLSLVGSVVILAWSFFCWQYILNVFVLGSSRLREMAGPGVSFSLVGLVGLSPVSLARSSPPVFVLVLTLTVLVLVGIVQKAGREAVALRLSALLLILFCPWLFNGTLQWPQFRLVLPALFLAGIDVVVVGAELCKRALGFALARWTVPRTLPAKPALPVTVWAVVALLVVLALSPRTLTDYTAYFYRDYREAYLYFADMPGQTIYSYGLRPYFLLGREVQHRVIYDLNPPRALVYDPGGLVRTLVDCTAPNFLVFSDHIVGNGYFSKLLVDGVEVVSESEHLVILRNPAGASGRRSAGCSGRYVMVG